MNTPDGASVRVIAGEVAGVQGPVRDIVTDPAFIDVSLPPGKSFRHRVKEDHTVFAYVIEGEGYFDESRDAFAHQDVGANYFDMSPQCVCGADALVLYHPGDTIVVTTEENPVRFLLVSGRPLQEPVAWHGPIVMNTQDELRTAFEEYSSGTFLRHTGS